MSKALTRAIAAAETLPEAEQDRLAAEIEALVLAARKRRFLEFLEWARSDANPLKGRSEELREAIRADRENWRFKHDAEGA